MSFIYNEILREMYLGIQNRTPFPSYHAHRVTKPFCMSILETGFSEASLESGHFLEFYLAC